MPSGRKAPSSYLFRISCGLSAQDAADPEIGNIPDKTTVPPDAVLFGRGSGSPSSVRPKGEAAPAAGIRLSQAPRSGTQKKLRD